MVNTCAHTNHTLLYLSLVPSVLLHTQAALHEWKDKLGYNPLTLKIAWSVGRAGELGGSGPAESNALGCGPVLIKLNKTLVLTTFQRWGEGLEVWKRTRGSDSSFHVFC